MLKSSTWPWAQFGGRCIPPLFQTVGYNTPCPPTFFFSRFVFGEVSKIKVTLVTFCVKTFSCSMVHIAELMMRQSLVWYHWFRCFINFSFNKMIFSIFVFLETAKDDQLLLSHNWFCGVYYNKVIALKQWEFYSCTCERPEYRHDLFLWRNIL